MSYKLSIKLVNKDKWYIKKHKSFKFYYRGFDNNYSINEIVKLFMNISFTQNNLLKLLNKLDGNFAIIVLHENFLFAAVDKIRSYPLLYYHNEYAKDKSFTLFDNYSSIENVSIPKRLDKKQINLFSLSGYTSGNSTILKMCIRLDPGALQSLKIIT